MSHATVEIFEVFAMRIRYVLWYAYTTPNPQSQNRENHYIINNP